MVEEVLETDLVDLDVIGGYAFVALHSALQVYDASDPTNLVARGSFSSFTGTGPSRPVPSSRPSHLPRAP